MTEHVILRLGHHGDGIAEGPLFAPRTLPGEVVTGEIEGQTLSDIRIQTPSEDRIAPPCRHYKSCGGCQLQHASDDFVAQWKQDVVTAALSAHGVEASMRPIKTSTAQSRRRATFAAKRTKKGSMVGFYGRGSDVVIEIPDCKLLHPAVMTSLPVAEALAIIGASRKAALAVTVTMAREGLDVSVQNGKPLDGPLRQELAEFCQRSGLARLTWDGETVAMLVPPSQTFGNANVVLPPGAFLQATSDGEVALVTSVSETVSGARRIADLFAGCGTFTFPLASNAEVHAVEGDMAMMKALEQGWRNTQGLKAVTTEARDLFRRPLLPDELAGFDAIVLDPPRAGAAAQVAELARAQIPAIAYVSCNPTTFARDAAVLVSAGYSLNWVQVVDQFRWSSHVELAANFTTPHMERNQR